MVWELGSLATTSWASGDDLFWFGLIGDSKATACNRIQDAGGSPAQWDC
jgi:hypothetical protein